MQQKSLPHKTGSLSKILMGTAMIGFLGIFSSNAVAQALDCSTHNNQNACESNPECAWAVFGHDKEGGICTERHLY